MMQTQSKGKKNITSTAGLVLLHVVVINFIANNSRCSANGTSRSMPMRGLKTESNIPLSTPHFGGCADSATGLLTCAIGPFSCLSDKYYRKPSQINNTQICYSPHVKTGRCESSSSDLESEPESCTPFSTSCKDPSLYAASDDTCNIVEDKSTKSDKLTRYPHCREKVDVNPDIPYRCVLSQDECIHDREYFIPIGELSQNEPCSCHDVPTGMCYSSSSEAITNSYSFCAVAEYDCPTGFTFMTAYELSTTSNPPRVCRLCHNDDGSNELYERGEAMEKLNSEDSISFAYTTNVESMDDDYDDFIDDVGEISSDTHSTWLFITGLIGSFIVTNGAMYFYKQDPPKSPPPVNYAPSKPVGFPISKPVAHSTSKSKRRNSMLGMIEGNFI